MCWPQTDGDGKVSQGMCAYTVNIVGPGYWQVTLHTSNISRVGVNMGLADFVLYSIAKRWPLPNAVTRNARGTEARPGTVEYARAYALRQFNGKVVGGVGAAVWGKQVLEIGYGHGGISCFLAVAGAQRVVGIDLNVDHLGAAREFAREVERTLRLTNELPVSFLR